MTPKLRDDVNAILDEITKLRAFKNFVHGRLDEAGVPTHPQGPHSKHGCRIGDRLDIALKTYKPPIVGADDEDLRH